MNYGRLLAWTIFTLSISASFGYLLAKDYRRSLYWFFAAGITGVVTW